MKRVLRFLGLAALCGLGLNALADGNVAKIGDTEYATIEEAHANVPDGGTIELIANAVLTQEIDNKTASGVSMHACKFTVDLKGYTLTMNSGIYTFYDITFKNGTIKISDPSGAEMGTPWTKVFYVEGNAKIAPVTLTFDHVKFVCEQATVTALIETSGTNEVNKPTVRFNECELDLASCGKPVNLGGSWPTVEFINSTIVAKDVSASGLVFGDNPHGLAKFSGGEVHMTDYGRLAANCQLEIENCVVTATGLKKAFATGCAVTLKNGAKVNLSASPSVKNAIDSSGLVAEAGCELKVVGVSTEGVSLNKASSVAVGADVSIDCPITTSAALQIAAGAYKSVTASGASAAIDLTGGIYKEEPNAAFVNPAYKAQANTDETTKADYPWMVAPPPPVAEVFAAEESKGRYVTLKEAFDAVADIPGKTATIKIIADFNVTFPSGFYIVNHSEQNITLDLNGKSICCTATANGGNALIENNGTLKIIDSAGHADEVGRWIGGSIVYETRDYWTSSEEDRLGYAGDLINNKRFLTVSGGKLENKTSGGTATYALDLLETGWEGSGSFTTVEGGEIVAATTAIRLCQNAEHAESDAGSGVHLTIKGGLIEGFNFTVYVQESNAVKGKFLSLNIEGGTILSQYDAICMIGSDGSWDNFTGTISGGAFYGDIDFHSYPSSQKFPLKITGGNFYRGGEYTDHGVRVDATKPYLKYIEGGRYWYDDDYDKESIYDSCSDLVVKGKRLVCSEDDTYWYVGDIPYVVQIVSSDCTETNGYETLSEAFDAVVAGETVMLLADSAEDVLIPVGVTFDTNGKAYTGTLAAPACYRLKDLGNGKWSVELDGDKCPVAIYDAEGNPTYYATFPEAVNAADDKGTISVNREIAPGEDVEIADKELTLDLAGQVINSKITFSGAATDFIIDSVGGGKVLGEIEVLGENCTLLIRAGTYAFDPSKDPTKWLDETTDPETGRALYVVVPQEGESGTPFYKVMPNQIEVKEPDPKDVAMTDENGNQILPSEMAEAAAAIVEANTEIKQTIQQNSAIDTGIEGAAKEPVVTPSGEIVPGPAKQGVVKALQAEAPEQAKGQITAQSDISSRLVIDIKQEIATIRTVETTEGETKKDAVLTTILYKVEPFVKTVVTVTDGTGGETTEEVEAPLPNEELKKNPLTFRLGIKDPQATGAYVRHIGHDEFEDETIFCKVQGPAGGRYVELTVDHFSDFEVRTVDAVVVDTDDAVGIVNLGVPGADMELAAAVPFLKSGVSASATAPNATLADLVVTGRENGDTIVFQKTGVESALSGDAWDGDAAQETGTAFWYKSVGSSVPLTLAGLVTDPVATEVTAGSADEPKATLLVNPYASAQDIFAAVGADAQDGDQVALVGGDRRYVREDGAWGYWKKSEYRANPEVADGGLFMSNEFVRVTSLSVPGGKGVWYVSKNVTAPTVAWTAGVQTGAAEQIADADLPTFGSVAWDVSLTAADMDAFAPEKVNLVAYDNEGNRIGDYARPLVVDALGQHRTSFLGRDGYDWADGDVTAAQFAVELLDAAENVIASTEKVGFDDLLTAKALDVTYAGDVTPAVALTPYVFAGFSVSDNGEFASLADVFAGFGYVTKTAGGLTVTLTNDMEGVVTIADNLGNVTLDLNSFSITGTNGVNGAGGVALAVTDHIVPGGAPTALLVKDRTGNGGKIVGGKGDRGAAGYAGGAAIVIAEGVTVALATGDALPLVKGGDGGTGYVSAGGAAGYAVAKASGEKVSVDGTDDTAQPGEFWEAWAWCVCDAPAAEIPGTYYEGTKLWIHRREGNERTGAAEFDFAELKDLSVVDGAIHFLPGHFGVNRLTVGTNASDSLAFLGDDAGTVLYAMAGSSMFDVNRDDTQSVCWTNITFTSVEVPDEAYGGSGRAICQKGGSFEVSQCAFSNLVDDVDAVGGAIRAAFLAKDSRIVGSVFEGNEALTAEFDIDGEGGAVYASAKEGADVTLAVVDCVFTGNRSGNGGAISVWSGYEPGDGPISLAVTDSLFEGNAANYGGGAIFGNPTKLLVDAAATKDDLGETAFVGNAASWTGGAIDLNAYESYTGRSAVTLRRGVRFVGNVASNETDYAIGGAIACWLSGGCDLVAEGVEFTGNLAFAPTQAIGGAMRFYENCAVTVDTCVFDDNDAVCTATSDYWCFGGAIESELGVTSIRNTTFRNSNVETVALWGGTAAVTNCVAVGNGETVGDYKYDDLYFENCSVDVSYSAWGSVLFYADAPDACAFTGVFNLTNRTTEIYAGDDTLRLNPVGFNPVAALGVKQEAYDFVGVKYGSKDYGSSMGAYETPTERLYVNLNGDKTYDGTTASNDVAWTWTFTTESGTAATWTDLIPFDADVQAAFGELFTLTNWVYGLKDHGFYATTNAAPRNLDAQIKGNDDVAQWYLDSGILKFVGTGTIARRPIEMGGLEFTVDPDEYEWNNGEPVDATVTVVERIGDLEPLTLAEGTDYHLTCSENTDYTKKAVATVDLLHNWIGTTNDTYYITAYLVEYLYDDVVDASLTETYGKTSGVAVVVSDIINPKPGYAFDSHNSPTNGVVRKFDEAGGVLRLKVCYYTDVDPADGTPDIYQRKVLAKVVNGGWSTGYRNDATLYVTMTNALGKWARTGSGIISYGIIPTGGNNALSGFSAGGWLALTSGGLVKVADPSSFTFDLGTVPFLVYAYSHGTTSGGTTHITRPGGGPGRPGSGSATQPAATDLLDQYKAVLSLTDATMAGNMFLIGTRIALKDVATGADLVSAVPPGGKTLLKTAATPTGPWTDIEVDVDTEGKAQVPVDAESAFFKGGDL